MSSPRIEGSTSGLACVEPEPLSPGPKPAPTDAPPNAVERYEAPPDQCDDVATCRVPFQPSRPRAQQLVQPVLDDSRAFVEQGQILAAAALLTARGEQLMREGRTEEAKLVFAELGQPAYGALPLQLAGTLANTRFIATNRSTTTIDGAQHRSTVQDAADVRVRQAELTGRMHAVLLRPIDLHDPNLARAYFAQFAQSHSLEALAVEFQAWLRAGFVHPGDGVEWAPAVKQDERADHLKGLIAQQPSDMLERKFIDCEGFAGLSERVLEGLATQQGELKVTYVSTREHVIAMVAARDEHFIVNNARVTAPTPNVMTDTVNELAKEVTFGKPDVFGLNEKPSESEPDSVRSGHEPPKLNSVIWSGTEIVGVVDKEAQRDYADFVQQQKGLINVPYSMWINARVTP